MYCVSRSELCACLHLTVKVAQLLMWGDTHKLGVHKNEGADNESGLHLANGSSAAPTGRPAPIGWSVVASLRR